MTHFLNRATDWLGDTIVALALLCAVGAGLYFDVADGQASGPRMIIDGGRE